MPPSIRALRAIAPVVLVAALATCSSGAGATGVPSTIPSASPSAAPSTAPTEAAGGEITIVGVDYAFQGLPATVPSGTSLTFENRGAEVHEMVVLRRNPGVTQSFEDLLQLPQDQAETFVTFVRSTSRETT
jgi:hypothetical protein